MKKIIVCLPVFVLASSQAIAAVPPEGVNKDYAILLSMLPVLLFVLLFAIVMLSTQWRSLLQEVLSDKEAAPTSTTRQPVLDSKGQHVSINKEPQFTNVSVYPKSTSRLVLFCSSLAAIFISISIVSASIYGYLLGCTIPDFSKLIAVVLSLGIGVVPYMTHKITKGKGAPPTVDYTSK